MSPHSALALLLLAVGACENAPQDSAFDAAPPAAARENWDHDLVDIDLELELDSRRGRARITTVAAAEGASLEAERLEVERVYDESGELDWRLVDGRLDVGTRPGTPSFTVDYAFPSTEMLDGWSAESGLTFLWPAYCDNLFPCISSPADGFEMTAEIRGAPAVGEVIYPREISAPAPSYMFAIAVGDYIRLDLGETAAGTRVGAWYLRGEEAAMAAGTAHLRDVFDFLETTYGAYRFGSEVASVSAPWGESAYGGMEHHPFWHVGNSSLASEEVHAHEAAHGWFGNGVRIACWEDLVLAEGVVTYLAARSLAASEVDLWPDYECDLKRVCESGANTIALPDQSCNEIDLLEHPLWSAVPYFKGAFFFREVARVLGKDELDAALAAFYAERAGSAARMQELVDHLAAAGERAVINQLADEWLRALPCPLDTSLLCRS